jgi:protein-arginine kinase activator protein McsA
LNNHMSARGSMDGSISDESMDAFAQAVSLQAQLNDAVEKQDYSLAATLRDKLQAVRVRQPSTVSRTVTPGPASAPDLHA